MKLHAIVADERVACRAVAAGATVVQVRLKEATTRARFELGRRLRPLPAMLVINDDVEAALRCGADGVHLGQADTGAERALAAGLMLGASARNADEALAAQEMGATYVGAGPVWATPSKSDAGPPIGVEGLAAICASVSVPVIAIGGVDASNVTACIQAGARGVAVIRAASDLTELRRRLDSALSPSGTSRAG